MAGDCGCVAVRIAAGERVDDQRQEGNEDEDAAPSDLASADAEEHGDAERDDAGIETGPEQRARGKIYCDAERLARAAIHSRIEVLEDRDADGGDEIPSEIVDDLDPEMRARRVVPEDAAEEPSVPQHAQWIHHEIDHHHEHR